MGIALLTFSSLFQGFSALQQRLAPAARGAAPAVAAAPRVWRTARPSRHWPVSARPVTAFSTARPAKSGDWPVSARPVTAFSTARPALRVLRVCEPQTGDAGRLVISGRRMVMALSSAAAPFWAALWARLNALHWADP